MRVQLRGYDDKLATKQKAADIRKQLARGEQGLVDPFADHKTRPLKDHLCDYLADLEVTGKTAKYRHNLDKRLSNLCKWGFLPAIGADGFCRWKETLPRLKDGRPMVGPVTQNQ
jgi:hypothetical protein